MRQPSVVSRCANTILSSKLHAAFLALALSLNLIALFLAVKCTAQHGDVRRALHHSVVSDGSQRQNTVAEATLLTLEGIVSLALVSEVILRWAAAGTKKWFSTWIAVFDTFVAVVSGASMLLFLHGVADALEDAEDIIILLLLSLRYGVQLARLVLLVRNSTRVGQPVAAVDFSTVVEADGSPAALQL